MSTVFGQWGRTAIRSAFAAGIALSLSAGFAGAADNATEDQILKALTPKRLTRSLSAAGRRYGQGDGRGEVRQPDQEPHHALAVGR